MEGYGLSQIGSQGAVSWNQLINKQLVEREKRSVLKERNCLSVGHVRVVEDSEGSRPIYITCGRPGLF